MQALGCPQRSLPSRKHVMPLPSESSILLLLLWMQRERERERIALTTLCPDLLRCLRKKLL